LTDFARAIAVDSTGNVIVGETTYDFSHDHGLVLKLAPDGRELWRLPIATSFDDFVGGVGVDASDNVFVAGQTGGALGGNVNLGGTDAFLMKVDPSGSVEWVREWGTNQVEEVNAVAVDSLVQRVYVAGDTGGNIDGNSHPAGFNPFVTQFDFGGNLHWNSEFGSNAFDTIYGAKAVDDFVYVAGFTDGVITGTVSSGSSDVFAAKINSNGGTLWLRQYGSALADDAFDIAIDPSDSVFVVGETMGSLDGNVAAGSYDAFVTRFDLSGNRSWTRQFGTSGDEIGSTIAVDAGKNLDLVGLTSGSPGSGLDTFVLQLDSSGTAVRWSDEFSFNGAEEIPKQVSVDQRSNLFVVGQTYGSLDGAPRLGGNSDVFVMKFDKNGVKQ
jgi:hypothetical protein